jgi:hypothetical protein
MLGLSYLIPECWLEDSSHPEGLATGQFDQGFSWFFLVPEKMMSWYPNSTLHCMHALKTLNKIRPTLTWLWLWAGSPCSWGIWVRALYMKKKGSNCQTKKIKICRHQDEPADWPSVATYLQLQMIGSYWEVLRWQLLWMRHGDISGKQWKWNILRQKTRGLKKRRQTEKI